MVEVVDSERSGVLRRGHVAGGACPRIATNCARGERARSLPGGRLTRRTRRSSTGTRTRSGRPRETSRCGCCAGNRDGGAWAFAGTGCGSRKNYRCSKQAFSDRQPFQALILLSSDHESAFFELIPGGRDAAPRQAGAEANGARSPEGATGRRCAKFAMGSRNWSPCRRRTSTAPRTSWPSSSTTLRGRGGAAASRPFGAGWEPRDGRRW